jgi:hypothetical protein
MTETWVLGWLVGLTIFMVVVYILVILAYTTDLDDRMPPKPPPGRYERLTRGRKRD